MNTKSPAAAVPSSQAGFTLVEIMVVIVILGLLATLVVQNVVGAGDEARIQKAQADVTSIANSVKLYRATKGKAPESLDVLTSDEERSKPWYLDNLTQDPWDHDYEIRDGDAPNEWEVVSLGPDGLANTEDDISSKLKREK
jgi:general secretion pathway protein G